MRIRFTTIASKVSEIEKIEKQIDNNLLPDHIGDVAI